MLKSPLVAVLLRYLGRLRFPYLLALTGTLFVLDLLVPDLIPLADELLLGLVTLLLALLKKPRALPGSENTATRGGIRRSRPRSRGSRRRGSVPRRRPPPARCCAPNLPMGLRAAGRASP